MARTEYREQLETLRNDVVDMSELVLDRYGDALQAVETTDPTLGQTVIERDREINAMYLDLEADCIDLFALQQPVAGDLRFVASSFKILTDLERVGDLATNIAADATRPRIDRYPTLDLREIGELAGDMVADAVAAYATDDAGACWEIAERDDDLDARCAAAGELVVEDLLDRRVDGGEPDEVRDAASRILLLVRDLERVGDHAVNVAARTLYMVDNDDSLLY